MRCYTSNARDRARLDHLLTHIHCGQLRREMRDPISRVCRCHRQSVRRRSVELEAFWRSIQTPRIQE